MKFKDKCSKFWWSSRSKYHLKIATTIFIIFTIFFIIMVRPIDIYNTRTFLYYTSFFYLSLNPVTYLKVPTPPIFLSLLLPQFYIYLFTLNLVNVSVFLTLINLMFSILLSIIVMKIIFVISKNRDKSYSAFYVLLFSPFMFFINFIFVEQDVVAIFITLAAFYLIYFHRRFSFQLIGVLLLAYATFFYYFPVLMIPSLVIYQKNWKDRLVVLLLLIFTFSTFYLLFLIDMSWSILGNGAGAISASSGVIPVFSLFNTFVGGISEPFSPLLTKVYEILLLVVVILVFIVPIIFKIFQKSIILPLLVTFSLPFLFLKIYNGDEFMWPIPFVTIAIAYYSNNHLIKTKLMLSQFFILPVIVVFNMWGAPNYGYGTGIFYFTYMTFHQPITIYSLIPHDVLANKILDIATFSLIFVNILYLMIVSRNKKEIAIECSENMRFGVDKESKNSSTKVFNDQLDIKLKNEAFLSLLKRIKERMMRRTTWIKLMVVILSFLLIGTITLESFPTTYERGITYSGGAFPVGLFTSSNTLMVKNLSYNYLSNNSFIQISSYSGNLVPPTTFSRNITNQSLAMNMEIVPQLPSGMIYSDLVGGFNGLGIYVLNQLELPKNYSYITPLSSQNLSLPLNQEINILNVSSIPTFRMNGTSIEQYNLSIIANNSYLLGFTQTTVNWSQNLFFSSRINGVSYEFFYSENSLIFAFLVNGSWKYETINPKVYSQSWNIMSFSVNNNLISFFINGLSVFTCRYNFSYVGENYAFIGMAYPHSYYEHKFAFAGEVTPLLRANSSALKIDRKLELSDLGSQVILPMSNNISINYSGHRLQIETLNISKTVNGNFSMFWFGRYSQYSPGVEYAFHSLKIVTITDNGLLLKIAIIIYGVPLFVTGVICLERIRR